MRTLNRPMFNMGGPIKQGIMHGIREPYKHGTRAALVGNPVYPKTGGREHHVVNIPIMGGIAGARWLATLGARKLAQKAAQKTFQNVGTNIGTGRNLPMVIKQPGWASRMGEKISGAIPAGVRSWFKKDPLYGTIAGGTTGFGRGAKWTGKKLYGAAKYGLTTPSGLALTAAGTYGFWPDGTPKEPPKTGGVPGGGDPGMTYTSPEKEIKVLSDAERKAFANKQREERVQKYLDMMGYDRSKKTAIADALIDASKIVSDRGTLDRKNITAELINPIIQATSKRLDKPEQIREAVGLMMTKAGLEKEMYDAKPGTVAKNVQDMVKSGKYTEDEAWAIATKGSQGAVADIQGAIATGKVGAGDWPAFVRSTGAQHGENVEVYTDEQIKEKYKDRDKIPNAMEIIAAEGITDDGIYVLGGETIRIKDGKVTQLR